jgi:hypothetical protein
LVDFFNLGVFLIAEVGQILVLHWFWRKIGWATFWAIFFTSGHPGENAQVSTLPSRRQQIVLKNMQISNVHLKLLPLQSFVAAFAKTRVARFFLVHGTKTEKCTNRIQNVPNGHKIFQISMKYSK